MGCEAILHAIWLRYSRQAILAVVLAVVGILFTAGLARAASLPEPALRPSSSPFVTDGHQTPLGPLRSKPQTVKPDDEPAGTVTLTFENLPEYTPVSNQYEGEGALFFGANGDGQPFIVSDGASSTNPTLSGNPLFEGAIGVEFVEPGTTTPTEISGFSVLVGYIDDPGSTQIDVYSCHGVSIVTADEYGFNELSSNVGCIYGLVVEEVSYEAAGFEIDNLSYTPGTSPAQGIAGGALSAFETLGGYNPAEPVCRCSVGWGGDPVNTATGDFTHTWTDLSIPGKGPSLDLSRTYNSLAHATPGLFGYGWSSPYDMHLDISPESGDATVTQGDGAEVEYIPTPAGFRAAPRVTATLEQNGDGTYTFTTGRRLSYIFSASGQLTAIRDLNGYETVVSQPSENELVVTDPSGRQLHLELDQGRVVKATDPLGHTVQYAYNGEGDLVTVTDPMGRMTTYTYDGQHRLLTWTDPRGGVLSNQYDGDGRVVKQTDPMGRVTSFSYGEDGVTQVTDPRGTVTTETYHEGFLSERTVDVGAPVAATWKYTYDPITGGQATVTDPLGHTTTKAYDAQGNVVSYTDALGNTTTYTYDVLNDRTSETDPLGVTTSYTYDGAGNLLSKSTPLIETGEEAVTTYHYEGEPGEVSGITNPDGDTTTYEYDDAGDVTSETDADGNKTSYAYNDDGERTSKTAPDGNVEGGDPAAHTTHYAYDADGELTGETNPLGDTTSYAYDGDGNRAMITDADGQVTKQAYDADNELTEVTRSDGSTIKTQWDADGNMIAQINGAGDVTTYSYDPQNRLTTVTDPDGHTTSYQYDAAGRKTAMVNAEGETTNYAYDADGELTGISYSDGRTPNVSESYDANGNRVEMTDGSGTGSFTYDSLNRMISAADGSGATVGYEYDLAGNLVKLTYPNGKSVTRSYDAAGRLESVTDWLGHTTHVGYDADGNEVKENYPNGTASKSQYDDADRLGDITDSQGPTMVASFNYTRDADGNITKEVANNGSEDVESYTYDALQRLTAANDITYGYDPADDPTTYNGGTQTFDSASELTSSTSPSTGIHPEEAPSEAPGGTEAPSEPGEAGEQPSEEKPAELKGSEGNTTTTGSSVGPSSALLGTTPGGGVEAFHANSTPARLDAVRSVARKGATKLTSPTVRVKNEHDLIVAFISAAGPASGGQQVTHLAGGGLHWERVARSAGIAGAVEIWQGRARGRFASSVTASLRNGGYPASITVAAFSGSTAVVTAHAASRGHDSAPSVELSAPASSLLWSVGRSTGQKGPVAPVARQQLVFRAASGHGRSDGWVQQLTARQATVARLADTAKAASWSVASVAIVNSPDAASASVHNGSHVPGARTAVMPSPQPPRGASSGGSRVGTSKVRTAASPPSAETRLFTYNARGDRLTEATPSSGTLNLHYDQADRLISVGDAISYAYDGDGLRVSKTVRGVVTHFVWNEAEPTPELLQGGATYYIYGPGGVPIEEISGETATYLMQDQRDSTRVLTDEDGDVVGRYSYDAWGNVTNHAGSVTTNLQYDGQYVDFETGYIYLRARYYDPSTGQFLTVDPARLRSRTSYMYGADDPIGASDPTGLWAVAACDEVNASIAFGIDFGANGVACDWSGGSGLLPGQWTAVTFTPGVSAGIGLEAGVSVGVGAEYDLSASSPQDLAGASLCNLSGSVKALAGAEINLGCDGKSGGVGLSIGAQAGANIAYGVGITYVMASSTEYSDGDQWLGGQSYGTGCNSGQLFTGTVNPQSGVPLSPSGGGLTVVP